MTRRADTAVRMGPVSLFALVVALCLAVMAVLVVVTARASAALAERQAAFTASDYANESVAQEFLARARAAAGEEGPEAMLSQVEALAEACVGDDGPNVSAAAEGERALLHVESESGRCLDVVLLATQDGNVSVASWKATTLWDEDTGDVLWTGQE